MSPTKLARNGQTNLRTSWEIPAWAKYEKQHVADFGHADAPAKKRRHLVVSRVYVDSAAYSRLSRDLEDVHSRSTEEFGSQSGGRTKSEQAAPLAAQAVDAVMGLVVKQAGSSTADAVTKLRQAVHHDAVRRPRHAAVALSLADALTCSGAVTNVQQTEAIRRAALTLLGPYISTEDERGVLTSLARAGMDRMKPLDEGPLAAVLRS